jgi:transcriptional regulator with PAS, ATPase and Fis domain
LKEDWVATRGLQTGRTSQRSWKEGNHTEYKMKDIVLEELVMNKHISIIISSGHLDTALKLAECEICKLAYEVSGRNQSKAAKLLGVSRGTFIAKLKEYTL